MLDLSYNNLSSDDILTLGSLLNLRVLHLSGNNIKSVPADISLSSNKDDRSMSLLLYKISSIYYSMKLH